MTRFTDQHVAARFQSYPPAARKQLMLLRQLIFDVATEDEEIGTVEETLKWGEPSYISKPGSTLRIDWKERDPERLAMYFNCQTQLVKTFRQLFGKQLTFDGNRAILLPIEGDLPVSSLRQCITFTLTYHRRKHLPMLGAKVRRQDR